MSVSGNHLLEKLGSEFFKKHLVRIQEYEKDPEPVLNIDHFQEIKVFFFNGKRFQFVQHFQSFESVFVECIKGVNSIFTKIPVNYWKLLHSNLSFWRDKSYKRPS